jgi:mono/diheme cytochrome c family protein
MRVLAILFLFAGAALAADAPSSHLDVWQRQPGDHTGGFAARGTVARVSLAALPLVEAERFDLQYDARRVVRGLSLGALLKTLLPPKGADAALLHFANGMLVPVPVEGTPDVFVAVAWKDGSGFTSRFPDVPKKGHEEADVRPITFGANKLVAAGHAVPGAPALPGDFTPWRHVDSLVGVEFVRLGPYLAQYRVTDAPPVAAGLEQFRRACIYCHGARRAGAMAGWDFVDPMPAHLLHPSENKLLFHVRYRANAAEAGLMMPALEAMSEADARALLAWLQALDANPLKPYAP